MDKLEQKLKTIAAKPHWPFEDEDFCIGDYDGGNCDDTFWSGHACGEVGLAQDLLKEFFPQPLELKVLPPVL